MSWRQSLTSHYFFGNAVAGTNHIFEFKITSVNTMEHFTRYPFILGMSLELF